MISVHNVPYVLKCINDVFKQQIARLPGFSQSGKLKEQGPSGISESFSSASDAECLTRESTAEQVEFGHCFRIGFSGVVNEPLSFRIKQRSVAAQCILVALAVSHTLESSGPTKSFPETADPGKHINKSNGFAHPLLLCFILFLLQTIIGLTSSLSDKQKAPADRAFRSGQQGLYLS